MTNCVVLEWLAVMEWLNVQFNLNAHILAWTKTKAMSFSSISRIIDKFGKHYICKEHLQTTLTLFCHGVTFSFAGYNIEIDEVKWRSSQTIQHSYPPLTVSDCAICGPWKCCEVRAWSCSTQVTCDIGILQGSTTYPIEHSNSMQVQETPAAWQYNIVNSLKILVFDSQVFKYHTPTRGTRTGVTSSFWQICKEDLESTATCQNCCSVDASY